jgi:peptidoglycan biosynthesis protein MviN/MurJ (putative lipid II flippase)
LANSITSFLNVWLLHRALRKKLGTLELLELRRSLKPVIAAMLVGALFAWGLHRLWDSQLGHASLLLRLGAVFVPAGIAAATYWAVLWADKLPAAIEVAGLIWKKLRRTP